MNNNNKNTVHLIIATTTTILAVLWIAWAGRDPNQSCNPTIGIIQTISHPALDQVREGYTTHLKQKLGSSINFIYQNADGSAANAYSIAKSYHANSSIKGILAIGTPAAQAIAGIEKIKPIYIAAVTDPSAAGLLKENKNVCGTTDKVDLGKEIEVIKYILPHAHTVAIVYNPAEANSVAMVQALLVELTKAHMEPIKIGVHSDAEITYAISNAAQRADLIIAPTDNLIVAAMPQVVAIALKYNKPVIATDNPSVTRGALASRGIDYTDAGIQTAVITLDIINGKTPQEVGIQNPHTHQLIVNRSTLQTLHLTIPDALKENVTLIG